MTEKWLMHQIEEKIITVPTFFLWVEPYLAGGHCIFLNPNDEENNKFHNYFNENELFLHNVIDGQEYLDSNPVLSKKEAGCQSSYMPYGSNDLVLFISNLFPKINSIILNYDQQNTHSKSFSWIGNKNLLSSLNINISEESVGRNAGTIYTN